MEAEGYRTSGVVTIPVFVIEIPGTVTGCPDLGVPHGLSFCLPNQIRRSAIK
jgi:hypothetical protein